MMRVAKICCLTIALLAPLFVFHGSAEAQRYLTFEAIATRQGDVTLQQRWMEVLKDSGADVVRIKSSNSRAQPTVEEYGEGKNASITVVGVINGSQIQLPNGKFRIQQKSQIAAYFKALKDDGVDVALSDKKAFGLTSKQLVELNSQLSYPIKENTQGEPVGKVVVRLLGKQKFKVNLDKTAEQALNGSAKLSEELKGLSIGTGLAAALRPLGLVLHARRLPGKETELHVVAYNSVEENWPVGWPTEKSKSSLAPKMFDTLDLEIKGIALQKVMNALENRTGIPFLYDWNGIARREIDLETKVKYTKKKAVYILAINKMLSQTRPKLKQEIRLDENGKPFLWISPMFDR